MSPHCVWLVIVGGYEELKWRDDGGGVKKPVATIAIIDTNRLIMIIELGKSYYIQPFCPLKFIFFMHLRIILIHNVILYIVHFDFPKQY